MNEEPKTKKRLTQEEIKTIEDAWEIAKDGLPVWMIEYLKKTNQWPGYAPDNYGSKVVECKACDDYHEALKEMDDESSQGSTN